MDLLSLRHSTRWGVVLLLLAGSGCSGERQPARTPVAKRAPETKLLDFYQPQTIGRAVEGRPWITHVQTVDLDQDGQPDILACDARANQVTWLRQVAPGQFEETVLASELAGPVHVEAADLDGDRDLDLLVASMGQVFPTNDKIGAVIVLENVGQQQFNPRTLLRDVARVTDVRAADFNQDGRLDLAVAQFGYEQGEIRWMENLGDWQFRSHPLLNLAGTIHVCLEDLNSDGTTDIAALVSQQWEEIHLFANDGRGQFTDTVIFGSTNEDFGSSGLVLCDLNGDGRSDLLYTNGDGFDYAQPGARPWHGVQWLENQGNGVFKTRRIGDLPGAYSPTAVDADSDGDMDVVVVSGFNDWENPAAAAFVLFRNDGRMNFTRHVLAHAPTHLVTCAVLPASGLGRPSLVTGGFHAYPPWDRLSRLTLWRPVESP